MKVRKRKVKLPKAQPQPEPRVMTVTECNDFWESYFQGTPHEYVAPLDWGPTGKVLGYYLGKVLTRSECKRFFLPYTESLKVSTSDAQGRTVTRVLN